MAMNCIENSFTLVIRVLYLSRFCLGIYVLAKQLLSSRITSLR